MIRQQTTDIFRPASAPHPTGAALARMDMHAHSWASSGPAIAALGLIDCPECCSPPEAVYDQAKSRGMDFVTITDHDTISGALELVERGFENFIVGEEVTVRFPEDGRSIHCLVWGLSPAEHEQLGALRLRDDIYSFAEWLRERDLAHAVAHPLDGIGDTRAVWRLERMALLFRGFELLNGAHAGGHFDIVDRWVRTLTPERLVNIGKRHRLHPLWSTEAPRAVTAGGDDHGLLNLGRTWAGVATGADETITADRFIERVMDGEAALGGQAGSPELLAHQFMSVGMNRYARPIAERLRPTRRVVARKIAAFAGVDLKKPNKPALLLDAARGKYRRRNKSESALLAALPERFGAALAQYADLAERLTPEGRADGPALSVHERMGAFSDELLTALTKDVAEAALAAWQERDWARLKTLARDAGAIGFAQAPYLISLFLHNKDRWAVRRIEHELDDREGDERPMRLALFTDTLGDINGVSRYIRQFSQWAERTGNDLHVFAFDHPGLPDAPNIHRIEPVFSAPTPGYEELRLHLPPLLSVLRQVNELQPDAIHVSTPGPMGITGAIVSDMVRAPMLATHHTDFPAYVQRLLGDMSMVKLCERSLRQLYSRCERVMTRSESYLPSVRRLRVDEKRIATIPAGVDSDTFTPQRRDLTVWNGLARVDSIKALYAGRVSVEKNTQLLEQVWKIVRRRCEDRGLEAELIVVGDGPDRARLEKSLSSFGARFLGYRHGEELATLYASADFFLFPSVTDTLGQVVLEAQTSGLPALVSTAGGPREIIEHSVSGYALPATDPGQWVDAAVTLIDDEQLRASMAKAARARVEPRTIDAMYEFFWNAHEEAVQRRREHSGLDAPTPEPLVSDAFIARAVARAAAM